MSSYAVRLPWPPSANTYYRRAGREMHISREGSEFKKAARVAIEDDLGAFDTITGRVGVSIELSRRDRRSYDVDNHAKAVLDAIEESGLIVNDNQVDLLHVVRLPPDATGNGYADVIVTELEQP